MARLDLQPFARALARAVAAGGELGHDAFLAEALGAVEGFDPRTCHMGAVKQERAFRQDLLKRRLALEERPPPQILAVEIEEVEHAIEETRRLPLGILQQLETRAPVGIERDELPIEHRLVLDGAKSLADRGIFLRDVVEVARIERRASGRRYGDGAEAVPLRLEEPAGIVEGLVGEGGEHGA